MEDELRRLEQQHERDVKEYRSAAATAIRCAFLAFSGGASDQPP